MRKEWREGNKGEGWVKGEKWKRKTKMANKLDAQESGWLAGHSAVHILLKALERGRGTVIAQEMYSVCAPRHASR